MATPETQSAEPQMQQKPLYVKPLPPLPVTYEQFLEWADEDTRAEWVDGVIVMASPVSMRHQEIANFLVEVLSSFVRIHSLGKIMNAPFQMKLSRTGREPDITFVAKDHLARFKQNYLDGPADLVVEIISPESAERDHSSKFYEYRDAGIPEYWLLDPTTNRTWFYQLDANGHYQETPLDADGLYHSRVLLNFWLRVAWLWQNELPDPVQALLEIDHDAYSAYLRKHMRQKKGSK